MSRATRFRLRKNPGTSDRAVRFLTREAARHVPYYREVFTSAELESDSVDSVDALCELPITPRRRLAELPYTRFLHEDVKEDRLYASHTSGSTGTPATIFLSKTELNYRRLLLFRAVRARFPRWLPIRVTDVGQVVARKTSRPTQWLGPIRLTRVPGNVPMSEQVRL